MKRIVALIMALVMIIPMNAQAEEKMSIELVERDSYGDIVTSDDSEHSIEWWTVAYKPSELYIVKQAKSFYVYADVTTAARNIVVQYSRDPKFQRGIMTKSFRNINYSDSVLAFLVTDGAREGNDWHYNDTVIVKQNNKTLHSRRKRIGEWSRLRITQTDVNTSRKKIRNLVRMRVTVNVPTGYYVRVRNVYTGNQYSTVYSGWSRIVKVR